MQILGLFQVCCLVLDLHCGLLVARHEHFVAFFLHWCTEADIPIDSFGHIILIQPLVNDTNMQGLRDILILGVGVSDHVVELVTFSSQWVAMTQYGSHDFVCCVMILLIILVPSS